MKLKQTTCSSLVAAVMAAGTLAPSLAQAQSSDALIDALIRKGVITEQEADDIKSDSNSEVRGAWKNGLNFASADGKFKGKIGGRVQLDVSSFSEDDGISDSPSSVEFRRVRLFTEGTYASSLPVKYKVQLDFADEKVAFKDVYISLEKIPAIGSITVGHFKEPIGLEALTSSKYLTFMERALPVAAFAPERNIGVAIGDSFMEDRATWSAGVFTDASLELKEGSSGATKESLDSDYRVSGRVTGLPVYEDGGKKLVHLGVSGSYISPEDDASDLGSVTPEAHRGPKLLSPSIAGVTDHEVVVGGEALAIFGPFSVQGEYLQKWISNSTAMSPSYSGYYVQGSWFVTGESRAYKKSSATIDRLKPKNNLSPGDGGYGAWELAVRYSSVDFDDGITAGAGEVDDITAGVNWYLNPNMKVQLNYVHGTVEDATRDASVDAVMARFHVDF